MTMPQLSIVRAGEETTAERAQRLFREARSAAHEQVEELEAAMDAAVELARAVAEGGDIYPAGVRELCRRFGEDAASRRQTLEALASRR